MDADTLDQAQAGLAPESHLCAACRTSPAEVDDLCGPCEADACEADRYADTIYSGFEIADYRSTGGAQ